MIVTNILSLDEQFKNSTSNKIVLSKDSYGDINDLQHDAITIFDSSNIDIVPSCKDGCLKGSFRLGKICPECGTEVKDFKFDPNPILWIKSDFWESDNIGFISPIFWVLVSYKLNRSIDCLRWLVDPYYRPVTKIPIFLTDIVRDVEGFTRSYEYLYNNLKSILIYFKNHSKLYSKRNEIADLIDIYDDMGKKKHSQYLSLPNKSLFIIENTTKGRFTTFTVGQLLSLLIDYIHTSAGVKGARDGDVRGKILNLYGKIISEVGSIYKTNVRTILSKKPGAIRKTTLGTRSPFTFRTVMTSINGPHKYDDLHIPWGSAVVVFRPQLINIITKMGYKYLDIVNILQSSVSKYNTIINDAFDILLKQANGRIPIAMLRNPSLKQGSYLYCEANVIKRDPDDMSTSYSVLMAAALNGDYDGDQHNMTLLQDKHVAEMFKTFQLHYSAMSLDKPFSVGKPVSMPDETISIISNYLFHKEDNTEYISKELDLDFV